MTTIIMTTPDELQILVWAAVREELHNLPQLQQSEKKFLTINEAAELLKLPKATLYQYTSQRLIPFTKSGRRIIFVLDELEEWLSNRRKPTRREIEYRALLKKDSTIRAKEPLSNV